MYLLQITHAWILTILSWILQKVQLWFQKKKTKTQKFSFHRLRWYFFVTVKRVTPGMGYSNDDKTNSWQTQIDKLSLPSNRETITGDKSNSRFCERREMQGLFLKPVLKQLGNRVSPKFLTNLVCFFPPRTLEPFCQCCSSLWTLRLGEGDGEGKNGKGKKWGNEGESVDEKLTPPYFPLPSPPSPPLATFSLFPRTKVPC